MCEKDVWDVITSVGTGLAVLVAAIATLVSVRVARSVSLQQAKLQQRQFAAELFDFLVKTVHINPDSPVEPDVVQMVNTLELISVSVEAEMVDAAVIRRIFRSTFLELVREIEQVRRMPGLNKSGPDLLAQAPSIARLRQIYVDELAKETSIPRLAT